MNKITKKQYYVDWVYKIRDETFLSYIDYIFYNFK